MLRSIAIALSSAALLATAVTADTCASAEKLTNIEQFTRFQLAYTQEQNEYWSTSCGALLPSCILYPKSAEEVAAIVNILNDNDEKFAVKSGGHNPNDNFSSISGGPLLSTKKLNQVILNADKGTVQVGPGNRWDAVAKTLDGSGWSVVGGRIGNVGVGGYMLGGGLSFMSQEYGWAANSVLEYEIVLANGTITTASATKNQDLFLVLKGGGNNFGIVTSYTLQAYRQGNVYGGNLVFKRSKKTDAQLLKAVCDFTEYNKDDKAAIILTAERAATSVVDIWVLFIYYDGETVPEGTFKNFTDAKPTFNNCKVRPYAEYLTSNNWAVLKSSVYTIGTESIPNPSVKHTTKVMGDIHAHWRNVSQTVLTVPGMVASLAYQPMNRRIAEISRQNGGDLMDFDDNADYIIELNYSYIGEGGNTRIDTAMHSTYGGIRERVLGWQGDGTMDRNVFIPLFSNDSYHAQDYYGRLRADRHALAKSVAEDLDPNGLFRDRTAGWKP